MSRPRFADVVILLPGLTGSVLRRHGKDLWGPSAEALLGAALSRGRLRPLVLEEDPVDRDDLGDHLVYRETEADEWRTVMDLRIYEYEAHGFDKDDRHFWLSSRTDRDQAGLFRVDLETGELGDPIVADPVYDVMNFGEFDDEYGAIPCVYSP